MNQTSALPSAMTATVHEIRSTYGELLRISTNDTEADMASREGYSVHTNVPLFEALDDIIPQGVPLNTMDDATWRTVRSEMATRQCDDKSLSPINPPDLPVVLANRRLNLVLRYWTPESVQSYVELSEIVMAGHNRRPVEKGVFSPESQASSFNAYFEMSYEEVSEHLENTSIQASEIAAENASERAAFGDSAPGSAINEAINEQYIRELDYALKNWKGKPSAAMPSTDAADNEPWEDIPY